MSATTYEDDLIKRARELQRLATKRRQLRRQLKAVDADIRQARKFLNAIKGASAERRPDIAPNRLFAGVAGFDYAKAKRATADDPTTDLSPYGKDPLAEMLEKIQADRNKGGAE